MAAQEGSGFKVEFKKSGLSANWSPRVENLMELAEDAGVAVDFSCRAGTCHTCLSTVIEGSFDYGDADVFEPDGDDEILICSARPTSNMVIDV